MADPDLFTSLGFKVQDLLAGLSGGIVNAFVFKRSDPVSIAGSIIVGAITANYLGETAAILMQRYIGTNPGVGPFIVGLCGMAVCQGIIEVVSKWRPGRARP